MIQKSRQSALLVAPILGNRGEKFVDSNYQFNSKNIKFLIKSVIHTVLNCQKQFTIEKKREFSEYFGVLVSKYIEKADLGIEVELSSTDSMRLRLVQMFLNSKFTELNWPPSLSHLEVDQFFAEKDSFEYHGNIKNKDLPVIKMKRRVKKHHTERYVGVGYKDKGSSKDTSNDGSPSWKESSRVYNFDKERTELILKNFQFKFINERKTVVLPRGRNNAFRKVELKKIVSENGLISGYEIDHNVTLTKFFVTEVGQEDSLILQRKLKTILTNGQVYLNIS
jgi:hypothetical protein